MFGGYLREVDIRFLRIQLQMCSFALDSLKTKLPGLATQVFGAAGQIHCLRPISTLRRAL